MGGREDDRKMNEQSRETKRIFSRAYAGRHSGGEERRGPEGWESAWNIRNKTQENGVSYGSILVSSIEKAIDLGRSEVVIVDIGSGEGNLLWQTRNIVEDLPELKRVLRDNSDFKIRIVGLTDAVSEDNFSEETTVSKNKQPAEETQIEAHNYHYTLTVKQDLGTFLREKQIEQVDLFFATWSTTYLGPKTFAGVVNDIVDFLVDGGRAYISAYAEDPMGYNRGYMGGFELNFADEWYEKRGELIDKPEELLDLPLNVGTAIKLWTSNVLYSLLLNNKYSDKYENKGRLSPKVIDRIFYYVDELFEYFLEKGIISNSDLQNMVEQAVKDLPISLIQKLRLKISFKFSPIESVGSFLKNLPFDQERMVADGILSFLESSHKPNMVMFRKKKKSIREAKTKILDDLHNREGVGVKYDDHHLLIEVS